MAISKVIYGADTLIDLTNDNVTPSVLVSGFTAHNSAGTSITGTIIARTASDIGVAGPTISVPSGAYSSIVTKTVASGSVQVDSITITQKPNISLNSSTGTVSASINGSVGIGAAVTSGYIQSASVGTVNISGSSSFALPTQAAITINPTESTQIAVDSGKYTIGNITVAAISSDYIGSNISQRSSSDIIVSGPTVTVPSGYYTGAVSKSVASGSLNEYINLPSITPSWSIDSSTGIVNAQYAVAPGIQPIASAGYFNTGEYIYLLLVTDSSYSLPTQAAATYTPSTVAQTIASGQYLTGTQTIAGDTNLIAANIASGVTIFGIVGTHTGGITPTGTISITSNGVYDVTAYASASVLIGATVDGARLIVPEGMIGV